MKLNPGFEIDETNGGKQTQQTKTKTFQLYYRRFAPSMGKRNGKRMFNKQYIANTSVNFSDFKFFVKSGDVCWHDEKTLDFLVFRDGKPLTKLKVSTMALRNMMASDYRLFTEIQPPFTPLNGSGVDYVFKEGEVKFEKPNTSEEKVEEITEEIVKEPIEEVHEGFFSPNETRSSKRKKRSNVEEQEDGEQAAPLE